MLSEALGPGFKADGFLSLFYFASALFAMIAQSRFGRIMRCGLIGAHIVQMSIMTTLGGAWGENS